MCIPLAVKLASRSGVDVQVHALGRSCWHGTFFFTLCLPFCNFKIEAASFRIFGTDHSVFDKVFRAPSAGASMCNPNMWHILNSSSRSRTYDWSVTPVERNMIHRGRCILPVATQHGSILHGIFWCFAFYPPTTNQGKHVFSSGSTQNTPSASIEPTHLHQTARVVSKRGRRLRNRHTGLSRPQEAEDTKAESEKSSAAIHYLS